MAYKERITFVYPHPSTFIQTDYDILSEEYDVRPVEYKSKIDILRLKFKLINTNTNISWFALGHATLSVLISKIFMLRSIVIVGGWDVVYMPEINYGAMRTKSRIRKTKIALNYATKVVCISKSIAEHAKKWTDRKDIEIIPLGIDSEKFKPGGEKENLVITAGNLKNDVTIKVKGLDYFFKCAQLLPDIQFIIVGNHDPEIMYKAFEIVGYKKTEVDKKFGHMIKSFEYGAPPHGGFAPGLDRLLMVLWECPSIRDIYAFPKNGQAQDVMLGAPSQVSQQQLKELKLKLDLDK